MNYGIRIPKFLSYSACLEGKDSYDNMKAFMDMLNDKVASRVTSKGHKYMLWVGGKFRCMNKIRLMNDCLGDMMFLSHMLGLGAHFGRSGMNCLFCEVLDMQAHLGTEHLY